jgi:hypothetical protein
MSDLLSNDSDPKPHTISLESSPSHQKSSNTRTPESLNELGELCTISDPSEGEDMMETGMSHAARSAGLSDLRTCISERDLATRVKSHVQRGGGLTRYMHGDWAVLDPEDNRVQKYAESVLQEAQVKESEASNIKHCNVSLWRGRNWEVERATFANQFRMSHRILDDMDEEAQEFEEAVQKCYEMVFGPKKAYDPARHFRRADGRSYEKQ